MTNAKPPVDGFSRRTLLKGALAVTPLASLMTAANAFAQGTAPTRGGVLTSLLTPEPPVVMLGVNSQGPTLIVGTKMFQPLFTFTDELGFKPVLAKSWEVSDDRQVYKFNLEQNVKFHDGTPMTAEDVIFTATKFMKALSLRSRILFEPIEKAEAPDDHTVIFTLKEPFAPWMMGIGATGMPIFPKHLNDVDDYRQNPNNARPIGTGPFKFEEWQRGNFIRLVRNDDYWKPGQPYLDEIIYRIVPDSQSRALALETGRALLAGGNDIEPFDLPRFEQQPDLTVTQKGWEYFAPISWIEINKRVQPLDDARVRRAMAMALDREFIVNNLWFGSGRPATGPLCDTTQHYDPAVRMPDFDIDGANALLDEAGLTPDSRGLRFTVRHMPLPYGEVWTRLSEYIRASMEKVGIALTIDAVDAGAWASRMAEWDFDTSVNYVFQVGDANLGMEQYFHSDNIKNLAFHNVGGYDNARVDELLRQARTMADPEERQKAISEFQRIAVEDMPYIFLHQMTFPTYHSSRLHNVVTTGMGISDSFDEVFLA